MALWSSYFFMCVFLTSTYIAFCLSEEKDAPEAALTGATEFANTLNDFGFKLTVQLMKENNNNNVLISPVAVTSLLAMALLGSVGRSYDELSDKLGFSQDILSNRKHHELLGRTLEGLNSNDTFSKTLFADGIFIDNNYKLRKIYRSFLSEVYHGETMSVDFKDCAAIQSLINDWVSNNTNGKLTDFLQEELPSNTKVVLLSALYFSGQWEVPFIPEFTQKRPFTTASGIEIMVDQMLNTGKFKYAFSQDGFDIMAFPYNDSVTTLYTVKPRFPAKMTINELMYSIDYSKINNIIDQMKEKKSVIRFPKLDLQSNTKLDNSLKALGIKYIFSPEDANFALMIEHKSGEKNVEYDLRERITDHAELKKKISELPNPGLHVDSVIHSVKIKIDEYGTEAAAAAAAVMARTAQLFYLNTPFYMFIRNEKTRLVTFSAVILDPTS